MATHSSILAWRISWTEEPGGLQSVGSLSSSHIFTVLRLGAVSGEGEGLSTRELLINVSPSGRETDGGLSRGGGQEVVGKRRTLPGSFLRRSPRLTPPGAPH